MDNGYWNNNGDCVSSWLKKIEENDYPCQTPKSSMEYFIDMAVQDFDDPREVLPKDEVISEEGRSIVMSARARLLSVNLNFHKQKAIDLMFLLHEAEKYANKIAEEYDDETKI